MNAKCGRSNGTRQGQCCGSRKIASGKDRKRTEYAGSRRPAGTHSGPNSRREHQQCPGRGGDSESKSNSTANWRCHQLVPAEAVVVFRCPLVGQVSSDINWRRSHRLYGFQELLSAATENHHPVLDFFRFVNLDAPQIVSARTSRFARHCLPQRRSSRATLS